MEGSGKEWKLKRNIASIGKKQFTLIPKNMDGIAGASKTGEIETSEKPPGVPDITTVATIPPKVRVGETFVINVKTANAAKEVFVELQGKRQPMEGSGTEWRYSTQIASLGTFPYKVSAKNKDGVEGKAKEDKITTTQKVGIDVVKVDVSPKEGKMGDPFTFTATTASAPKGVTVVIKDKRYNMTGSGTSWSLKQAIEDFGSIDFYVVASDDKGVDGSSMPGSFKTKAVVANVIDASSPSAYAGEEFTITANTDNPASSVSVDIDGVTYDMEGSGKKWQYKKRILDVGKKQFVVKAKNIEGAVGSSKTGVIVAKLGVPNVASVSPPAQVYAGEDFIITAKTATDADKVSIEIAGKSQAMEGAGTDWTLQTKIASAGTIPYKVTAKNTEGKEGTPKEGNISVEKKAGALINIASASVSPDKGYAGGTFTFKAATDSPAKGVMLSIGGKEYEMTGSGTSWILSQQIDKPAKQMTYSVAALNEDKEEGIAKTGTFAVSQITDRYTYNADGSITDKVSGEVKKRFVDNGNGTVTDISTNLMWMQSPKRVAVSYEEAEDYCSTLTQSGLSGWRLPTADEWQDIIDKSQQAPSLPKGHPFKNIVFSVFFWSKTKHTTLTQRIYVADLYTGKIGAQGKDNQYIAWPVRYAEAAVQ
jgi:hypothetical protein